MAKLTADDIKRVKGMGFLKNTTNEGFSMRVITKNGVLTSSQMRCLGEVADRWGQGTVALTTRLTAEIPGIRYEDIEAVREFIGKEGLVSGGTGSRVRPVVACKGTVCQYGNCDTQALALRIHDRFFVDYYDVKLPHKFKIAVGGCPNNCVKPDLNDLGLAGVTVPDLDGDKCLGCRKCAVENVCPMDAAHVVEGKLVIDREKCNNCGRCVTRCRFDAVTPGKKGFAAYLGGRWGKKTRIGSKLPKVYSEEEAMELIEKAILLFRDKGENGERLASMVDRLGEDAVFAMLEGDDLLRRKEEILNKEMSAEGGATC